MGGVASSPDHSQCFSVAQELPGDMDEAKERMCLLEWHRLVNRPHPLLQTTARSSKLSPHTMANLSLMGSLYVSITPDLSYLHLYHAGDECVHSDPVRLEVGQGSTPKLSPQGVHCFLCLQFIEN